MTDEIMASSIVRPACHNSITVTKKRTKMFSNKRESTSGNTGKIVAKPTPLMTVAKAYWYPAGITLTRFKSYIIKLVNK